MLCNLKELMIKGSTDLNLVQPYACNVHARPQEWKPEALD